jgi:hypothetical protein
MGPYYLLAMSNDNPTVEIDGTELEIRETDDGFEAVEIEESEKPDHISDSIWNQATDFSDGEPTVTETNTALTFVEDDDIAPDFWVDVDGKANSDVAGHIDVLVVTDTYTPDTVPTVEYDGTEIGIKETDDGYEAVAPTHAAKPDGIAEYVWNRAQRYMYSDGTPTVYETNSELTFVEDADGDLWVDVGGRPLGEIAGSTMLYERNRPDPL